MAKRTNTAVLEMEYQEKHKALSKAEYARMKRNEDLDEAAKKSLRAGGGERTLKSMGQDSLAYARSYQAMLDAHEKKKSAV